MRVAFFGTPEFAVPSLRALVGEGFDVVAVVTQPDAPQGRSRSKLIPPPVKVAAEGEEEDAADHAALDPVEQRTRRLRPVEAGPHQRAGAELHARRRR